QSASTDSRYLAAQLAADRAASAGHEHDLAGEIGADALELHQQRLASEHVLDPYFAQLARDPQLTRSVLEQFEHRGCRADRYPPLATGGDHACPDRSRRRRYRDDHLAGLHLVEHPREILAGCRAEHLEPVLILD